MPAGTSIVRLKAHYFFLYGIFGSTGPYMSLYLRQEKNLELTQIGLIFAIGQVSVLFMPAVVTHIADRHRLVRPLLMVLFAVAALSACTLSVAAGVLACLVAYCLGTLVNGPHLSLSDGLLFAMQRTPTHAHVSYAEVRLWGTVGYMLPNVVLFAAFKLGAGLDWVPMVSAGGAALGIFNAWGLPQRLSLDRPPAGSGPTWQAARVLARPSVALFLLGVGLVVFSNAMYYSFYPLYLTQVAGISADWVGLIAMIGVVMELTCLLGMKWAQDRIGLRGLMVVGGMGILLRMICLAFFPTAPFAIGLQLVHGLATIGYMMAPVIYLNSLAGDEFRNSIQGWWGILMGGVFSISGNLAAGYLADGGLIGLYRVAFGVAATGLMMVAWSFLLPQKAAGESGRG